MAELPATPAQTVGPFFTDALRYPGDNRLIGATHADVIRLHGKVYDGEGEGIPDALVEVWQRGPDGEVVARHGSLRRDNDTFTGWGRCATDTVGHYSFTTLPPGSASPFFAITVFARGLLSHLFTRAYLPGPNLDADPLFRSIGTRRGGTLVCAAELSGYRFDIHLQGPRETVFLEYRDT